MRIKRPVKVFLLGMVAIVLLWVIHSYHFQNQQFQTDRASTYSELPVAATKVVKHAFGEVTIPVKPQRIIVLNDISLLDPVLSLGIKPIGTVSYLPQYDFLFRGVTNAEAAGIEIVGIGNQPILEKVLLLKPDVILMREYQRSLYQQLSAIAPTVVIDLPSLNYSFKENLRFIAQVLGETEKAEQVIAQYYERVKQLQQLMGERLKKIEVSVINVFTDGIIATYSDNETYNQVLQDIGIPLIPALAKQKETSLFLNIEVLNKYDADILFVMSESKNAALSFSQNPLLSTLKAAKNHRVYTVQQDRWWTYGFLGVNKLLDDLFKYLT
ncbi:iron-siderophore ABC transporter substrate-binding protein [Chlorogloeopsis sp. ULAP02]|uniref:iron-siderophore ABC transporter substrate-binding protein n=1 Tax=Chlorogloeopsis sp. ULAP02 TaxID=3107926 RepID=UPI003136B9F3